MQAVRQNFRLERVADGLLCHLTCLLSGETVTFDARSHFCHVFSAPQEKFEGEDWAMFSTRGGVTPVIVSQGYACRSCHVFFGTICSLLGSLLGIFFGTICSLLGELA